MLPSVSDLVADPAHAGALDGADRIGGASGGTRLVVRVGLWLSRGSVTRARFRSSTCAALIAYAEAACRLLEGGAAPEAVDAARLVRAVRGVHPAQQDRAALVSAAVVAAPVARLRPLVTVKG
ncbi:MAG TPA: iron-sulfur cluster assembly scaffold protein [Anaeromyxobacteraceae bacterium]|nr:iron-sulfur cluster assembly scaffold protein [Anaeromyxobacteraceae bacterium]